MAKDDATVYRPYAARLLPSARKLELLQDTYDFLKRGQDIFFDFLIKLTGGIQPKTIKEIYDTKPAKNKGKGPQKTESVKADPQLICAAVWFKLVKRKKESVLLTPQSMINSFREYYGEDASDVVKTYLNSNQNKDEYVWLDCRQEFIKLSKEIGTTPDSLSHDLDTMLMLGDIVPYDSVGEIDGWGAVSRTFGKDKKADIAVQKKFCDEVLSKINEENCKTFEDYKKIIFEIFNASTIKELKNTWNSGAGVRSAKVIDNLGKDTDPEFTFEKERKNWEFVQEEKSFIPNRPNYWAIIHYMEGKIGDEVDNSSWAVMYQNAIIDICSKITRNHNFSYEQTERKKELSKCDTSALELVNGYFKSTYFKSGNEFIIENRHVPNIGRLIELYSELTVVNDDNINEIIEIVDSETKVNENTTGDNQLKKYILSISGFATVHQIEQAMKYNKIKDDIEQTKAHPFVSGNASFTVGNSALKGSIASQTSKHKGKIAGQSAKIWLYIHLYHKDIKEWREHHIPFYHAKFFEEVYYFDPALTETVKIRNKKMKTNITKENIVRDGIDPRFAEKNIRTAAVRQNCRANVAMIPSSLELTKKNGEFTITISQRFPKGLKRKKSDIRLNDIVMAYDQNQTRPNTYSILRVTSTTKDKDGRYPCEFIKGGDIRSFINTKTGDIDVINYDGVDNTTTFFVDFVRGRTEFIHSVCNLDAFKKTNDNNLKYDFNCLGELARTNREQTKLYRWQNWYLRFLLTMMKLSKGSIPGLRSEIIYVVRFMDEKSSLSQICIENIRSMKKIINSWFSYEMKNQDATNEEKELHDKEMYALLKRIEQRRSNKNKERIRKIASAIVAIAQQEGANIIVGEKELDTKKKGKNKASNNRAMDWCPGQVSEKVKHGVDLLDISFFTMPAFYTSHQDPFVYSDSNREMRPRMDEINPEAPNAERKIKSFVTLAKMKPKKETMTQYYSDGVDRFCVHNNITRAELKKIKTRNDWIARLGSEKCLVPVRGGRYYLSAKVAASGATQIVYAGETRYLSSADHIAATNIGLSFLVPYDPEKQKKKKGKNQTAVDKISTVA